MDTWNCLSSIFMLSCTLLGIVSSLIILSVVTLRPGCRTKTNLLMVNSAVAGFLINAVCVWQSVYQLAVTGQDSLCEFRGFLLHAFSGLLYHTLLVQALHRLFVNVFAAHRLLQSNSFIISMVTIQWLTSTLFGIPVLLTNPISYQAGSQICLTPLGDLFGFLYMAVWIYLIPISSILLVYASIVRYVKKSSIANRHQASVFQQRQQKREIRLLRRLLSLLPVLCIMGIPYTTFFILTMLHGSTTPIAERISFIFISFGYGSSMAIGLITNDEIWNNFINSLHRVRRRPQIQCITTIQMQTRHTNQEHP